LVFFCNPSAITVQSEKLIVIARRSRCRCFFTRSTAVRQGSVL
jgi:hypothetical protein